VARDQQKDCVDQSRKSLKFNVSVKVIHKLSPWKGFVRFGRELSLRYIYIYIYIYIDIYKTI
jgi:hypothetical protein